MATGAPSLETRGWILQKIEFLQRLRSCAMCCSSKPEKKVCWLRYLKKEMLEEGGHAAFSEQKNTLLLHPDGILVMARTSACCNDGPRVSITVRDAMPNAAFYERRSKPAFNRRPADAL